MLHVGELQVKAIQVFRMYAGFTLFDSLAVAEVFGLHVRALHYAYGRHAELQLFRQCLWRHGLFGTITKKWFLQTAFLCEPLRNQYQITCITFSSLYFFFYTLSLKSSRRVSDPLFYKPPAFSSDILANSFSFQIIIN